MALQVYNGMNCMNLFAGFGIFWSLGSER